MLAVFQILFVLFSLFVIGQIFQRRKNGLLSITGTVFWILLWLLAILAVLLPQATQVVASYFGIGRGTDFVVYVSFAIMFFVLFRLHIKLESMQRDITKIVRKDSLEDAIAKK